MGVESQGATPHREVEYRTEKFIFTDEDRIQIVSDYVQKKMTADEIVAKYNFSGRQVLLYWVNILSLNYSYFHVKKLRVRQK